MHTAQSHNAEYQSSDGMAYAGISSISTTRMTYTTSMKDTFPNATNAGSNAAKQTVTSNRHYANGDAYDLSSDNYKPNGSLYSLPNSLSMEEWKSKQYQILNI